MICPQCKAPNKLQAHTGEHFRLYACECCGGFWFNSAELGSLSKTVDEDIGWLQIEFWREQAQFKLTREQMPCPCCEHSNLVRIVDQATNTSAATCPTCLGIWMDAGQLDRIVAVISDVAEQMNSADYVKESLRVLADLLTLRRENEVMADWRDLKTVLRLLKYRLYSEHPRMVSAMAGVLESLPV